MPKLNIGTQFSFDPLGRFYTDGDSSGEEFREEVLLPKLKELKKGEKLEVVLDDNVESYGSSFLTEGFAGLVKYGYFTSDQVEKMLTISYTDEDYSFFKDKIYQYLKEAEYNSKEYESTKKLK